VEIASFSYVFSRRRGRPLRAGMEPFMELSRREGADVPAGKAGMTLSRRSRRSSRP
jgi:hypothetical protein